MSLLTPNGLPKHDRLGNPILTDWRNMIRLEDALEDTTIPQGALGIVILKLLYGSSIPSTISAEQAFDEVLWFYSMGKPERDKSKHPYRLYDFNEDAEYIYSAFLSIYRINLTDSNLEMHWWEFLSLFISLPDETRMAQLIHDRGIDLSEVPDSMRDTYEKRQQSALLKVDKTLLPDPNMSTEEKEQFKIEQLQAAVMSAKKQNKGGD